MNIKYMYIEALYEQEGVEIISRDEALFLAGSTIIYAEEKSAFCFYEGDFLSNKVYIGREVDHKEAAMWHELGHMRHPLGAGKDEHQLTKELAANSFVLANYQGEASREEIIYWLSKWIKSYANCGDTIAKNDVELKETAKILGVFDDIIWEDEK